MELVPVNRSEPDRIAVGQAAAVLAEGGLVAFPTETVYGLGVALNQPDALRRLFELKGRAHDKPLTLHLDAQNTLWKFTSGGSSGTDSHGGNLRLLRFLDEFWPGPLNVIVTVDPELELSPGQMWEQAGFRLPDDPTSRMLAACAGGAILATSANRSGNPSPVDALTVVNDIGEDVDFILDAGPCPGGEPSTVIRIKGENIEILRSGALYSEILKKIFSKKY